MLVAGIGWSCLWVFSFENNNRLVPPKCFTLNRQLRTCMLGGVAGTPGAIRAPMPIVVLRRFRSRRSLLSYHPKSSSIPVGFDPVVANRRYPINSPASITH